MGPASRRDRAASSAHVPPSSNSARAPTSRSASSSTASIDPRPTCRSRFRADYLVRQAEELARDYPDVSRANPYSRIFTRPFRAARPSRHPGAEIWFFFPGSTIGNFTRPQAADLLEVMKLEGGRRRRAPDRRRPAQGTRPFCTPPTTTARASRRSSISNVLKRFNRELGANFDLEKLSARGDLRSGRGTHRNAAGQRTGRNWSPSRGTRNPVSPRNEHIITEYSHKYSADEFRRACRRRRVQSLQDVDR